MALPILDGNQSATTLSTILTGGAHIPAHTVVSLGTQAIFDIGSAVSGISVSVAGTQSVTGSVSVLNFPATQVVSVSNFPGTQPVSLASLPGSTVTVANFPSTQTIAGTVTASNLPIIQETLTSQNAVVVAGVGTVDNQVPVQLAYINTDGFNGAYLSQWLRDGGGDVPISGTVTVSNFPATQAVSLASTTVTVSALPNGALTTRFGSVTTANTAQISAVTNTSRKYLLAQNISAGTVTIGIGFSPTTTQGIQLAAGGGLTFDAFCPTGAIFWLGAVTGANYCLIEG